MSPEGGEVEAENQGNDTLVVSLAQSFSDRHRNGERPTIEEYVGRYPELADEIRELFPMLAVLEDLGPEVPASAESSGERGAPRQIGEYRIIREIGRGGMGVVYEAEQQSLKRRVALKVLPFQALQDKQQLERFHREAQAAARLHHTNIVPVFGVGEGDRDGGSSGVHYYVMQFIRGQTLAQVLQELRKLRAAEGVSVAEPQPGEDFSATTMARTLLDGNEAHALPPTASVDNQIDDSTSTIGKDSRGAFYHSAAKIALQVAEALAYAHNEGVLHRDIKPSNLLIDLRGTVWITDFGLAKVQGSGELTASGGLVGTLRYMAPERFRGMGDARSDVYSLGITLFELVTLRPAFAASDRAEIIRDITSREPPAPRRLDATIPRDLETVILKSIAKDAKDRYSCAASFADDLRRFIHREPVSARRATPPERLWRWSQRNPALAVAASLIALLLVTLAVGGMLSAALQRDAYDEARTRLVQAKLAEGRASRFSREPGGRARSLAALGEAVTPESASRVRSEIIGALALVDLEGVYRRESTSDRIYTDPLLTRFAVAGTGGEIVVYDDKECKIPIATLPPKGKGVHYAFMSPGGHYLASAYRNESAYTSVLWDVDAARPLLEAKIPEDVFRVAFDGNAKRFAYLGEDWHIVVTSLPPSSGTQRIEEANFLNSLAFSPDGNRLAAAGMGFNNSSTIIYDLTTGKALARLHHPATVYAVAWHPGGRRLATSGQDFNVHIWDPDSGLRLRTLEGHSAEVVRLEYSHDGRYLASSGWDNRTLLWEADTGDRLTETGGSFSAFSSDDRLLGIDQGPRCANILRLSGGECYRTLDVPLPGKGPKRMDMVADGSWLATASDAAGIHLWSLSSTDETYRVPAGHVRGVQFQKDGKALWVAAEEGLFRWPMLRGVRVSELTLGPPEQISEGLTTCVSLSDDSLRVATVADSLGRTAIVLRDLRKSGSAAVTGNWAHPWATRCEVSSSGRWVASTTFQGADVRVWDAEAGALAHSFEVGTAGASFSPDEKWLAISWDSWLAVYSVGSWELRFKLQKETTDRAGGLLKFTADGRFLAATLSRSLVALLRVDDGSEVARFEAPTTGLQITDLAIDEDQRFLAVSSSTNKVLLWNLRALRFHLRAMGLDWGAKEPLAGPVSATPSRLQFDAGSLSAFVPSRHDSTLRKNRIIDGYSRRIELEPGVEAYRARAVAFEEVEDLYSALDDLTRLLAAAPDDLDALSRRAVMLERMGRKEEAAKDFDRVIGVVRDAMKALGDAPAPERLKAPLLASLRSRGRASSMEGFAQLAQTRATWKEVLSLVPGDVEACGHVAWLWIVERCAAANPGGGALDEEARFALACAETSYKAKPEDGVSARDLGAMRYYFGQLDEARPLLEKAWRLNQMLFSAQLHLAMVEHRKGDSVKARKLLESATSEGRIRLPQSAVLRQYFEAIAKFADRELSKPEPTALAPRG